MWENPDNILNDLIQRHPDLSLCKDTIQIAFNHLLNTIKQDGTIFTCGNGGSAADAEHIVGELLKGFMKGRKLDSNEIQKFDSFFPGEGKKIAQSLQQSIKAVSLTSHISLMTAFMNDVDPAFVFAQQLYGLGRPGDSVIAISTSGNSKNIINACKVARAQGITIIGLTGETGGQLKELSDVCICTPSKIVPLVQEYHLPIYHALCAMLEIQLFKD